MFGSVSTAPLAPPASPPNADPAAAARARNPARVAGGPVGTRGGRVRRPLRAVCEPDPGTGDRRAVTFGPGVRVGYAVPLAAGGWAAVAPGVRVRFADGAVRTVAAVLSVDAAAVAVNPGDRPVPPRGGRRVRRPRR